MKKIESLTPEQKAKFPEYVNKWVDIGTKTDRLDYDTTLEIVTGFRNLIGRSSDVPLVIAENPIEAWVLCCLHEQGVKLEDLQTEMKTVFKGNPKGYEIPTAHLPYQTGSFFASVFSFYDYIIQELKVDIGDELLDKYKTWEKTSQLGCIYPLDNLTVVCQKPTTIKLNENNVLHCDGGAALEYSGLGDFKVYALNGVTVPEYLAVTPGHKLDLEQYKKETNADVKAEFIRKAGIERFLDMGKLVDTYQNYDQEDHVWWWKSEYELWEMKDIFTNLDSAPYLKMVNQTTSTFHLEGVSPKCKTIAEALRERFGGRDFIIKNIS